MHKLLYMFVVCTQKHLKILQTHCCQYIALRTISRDFLTWFGWTKVIWAENTVPIRCTEHIFRITKNMYNLMIEQDKRRAENVDDRYHYYYYYHHTATKITLLSSLNKLNCCIKWKGTEVPNFRCICFISRIILNLSFTFI